jgi:hypothetical protein
MTLVLSVYLRADVPNKVVMCFAETGQLEKIVLYSKVGFQPDYATLLQHITRTNPEKGAEFATQLVRTDPSLMRYELSTSSCLRTRSYSLLNALRDNKPGLAHPQTRLLEMNLYTRHKWPMQFLGTRCSHTMIAHELRQVPIIASQFLNTFPFFFFFLPSAGVRAYEGLAGIK